MIYTTPTLHMFEVSWPFEPDNLPMQVLDAQEFLAERFIDDVVDTCGAGEFVIVETRLPGHDSNEVIFHIVTTLAGGKIMQDHDFEIHPLKDKLEGWDYRIDPHDGMTWGELQLLICRSIAAGDISANEIAGMTKENDPAAPLFVVTDLGKDEKDWRFLTVEECKR